MADKNNQKTKHGRVLLKPNVKRKYQVLVRLKTEEKYTLIAQAKNASLSKQEYIRQCIMNRVVIARISPELCDMIRKLSGMANNLNQIAKKANQAGYLDVRKEYLYLAENIANLINLIKK
jgi:hypothetical protein